MTKNKTPAQGEEGKTNKFEAGKRPSSSDDSDKIGRTPSSEQSRNRSANQMTNLKND